MALRDYVLYDTAPLGNVAGITHTLFQTAEGGSATHTKSFTNNLGSGRLPETMKFVFDKVGFIPDYNTVIADIPKMFVGSFLSIEVRQKEFIRLPLALCFARAAYGGHYTQAAAADEAVIGLLGDGFMLRQSLELMGGVPFKVNVYQDLALAAANSNCKVVLVGMLDDGS